jgi:nitrile hydratase subunit beta
MNEAFFEPRAAHNDVVLYTDEEPAFRPGDSVRVLEREPIGHYRVPRYLRGKTAVVERVISPIAVDNEEEGFGRDAGNRGRYYRISVLMHELWADYAGHAGDALNIEVYQSWLEKAPVTESNP